MKKRRALEIFVSVLQLAAAWKQTFAAESCVDGIEPRDGSLNGQTRITINGRGFARNLFNFGDGNEHVGNKVQLVSDTSSYECAFHPDGSHETQIMCYTPKLPSGEYKVRVSVDGVDIPEDCHCKADASKCKFEASSSHTPTLDLVEPLTGVPGTQVKFRGKLITNRYGSNIPASSNGKTEKLLRVYLGSQNCELKNLDDDILFGIDLDNDGSSVFGNLLCNQTSTYVSSINGSFIIEGGYGRSLPNKNILRVSSTGAIYMYQTYAPVYSVSPSMGSLSGGTRLTITGRHFDETDRPVKVKIADSDCPVVEPITDTQIVCQTPPDPSLSKTAYKGNRGLTFEIWNTTLTDLASISGLSTSASDYSSNIVDVSHYKEDSINGYVTRMSGFFLAPATSVYQFYIKGDDQVELYLSTDEDPANKVKMCEASTTTNYFKSSSQVSARVILTEGNSYYMEILHREVSSSAHVTVAARAFSSKYTNSMTGMAWQEKQKVRFASTVVKDELTVVVTAPAAKTATKEVQTISCTGNGDAEFRLGIMGVYTEPLLLSATETTMQAALNKLPILGADDVSVAVTPVSGGNSYAVTFNTNRGDIPLITYQQINPNITDLTITVTQTTAGASSLDSFSFSMDGVVSPPVSVTATPKQVKEALLSLFSVNCPADLSTPSGNKFFENFESSVGSKFGVRHSDVEPFCGRFSSKNPSYLYDKGGKDEIGISLSQYGSLCFAYKGRVKHLTLRFSYVNTNNEKFTRNTNFNVPEPEDITQWSYACSNMYDTARAKHASGSDYRVERLYIVRHSSLDNLYVDTVAIVRQPTTTDTAGVNVRRQLPAKPNGALIRDVEVTSDEDTEYKIKLDPHDCGFDFPLLGIAYGKTTSGSVDKTSDAASFSVSNGGTSIQISVTRTATASPPISGSFTLSYKGQTTQEISPSATAAEVTDQLQALSTLGNMEVEKTGTCANFDYIVEWVDQGGDLDEMTVNGGQLTGNSVAASVVTVTDGSIWYDPIVGDMLRTKENKPQVMVDINGIPSRCTADCGFQWDSSATPSITSISPTSGSQAQSTSVVISGSNLDSNETNVIVTIAGVNCSVTAATTTSVTCDVGNGPTGNHKVKVIILGKGQASGSVTFDYVSDITSMSPTTGSIGGGTSVTISGYGFTGDATVTVDDVPCLSTVIETGEITCVTPPSATTSGGTVDVIVSQHGANLTSPNQFTYDASSSNTPVISSLSTTSSSVEGGSTITISGSGFGSSANPPNPLTIGGQAVTISNYSDTEIIAVLPSSPPGSYPVLLQIGNLGYADLRQNSISNIMYVLKVTNIFPNRGSLYGGTRVTITGQGFVDNTSIVEVKFGHHLCDIEEINSTQIVCKIQDTSVRHDVANTGTHKVFGYGYGWNPNSIQVKVGDRIRWSWTTPQWVNGIGYRIEELVNASTTQALPNGFNSGATKTKNGNYEYRFGATGDYHYWSDFADDFNSIFLKGKVTVVPATSHTQVLKLTVAGHEASYETGGPNPAASSSCPGSVTTISDCSDPEPNDLEGSKFNFKFWSCSSPVINMFNISQGTAADEITVEGSGFSSNNCENEIQIGDAGTLVQSSSGSSVTFKVDPSTSPKIGVPQTLSMRVSNRGNTVLAVKEDLSRRFVLLPVIESMTPTSGSTAGGTLVTLTGSGFQGSKADLSVIFQGYDCEIQSLSYTRIVCSTPSSPAGLVSISVTVAAGGNTIPASCDVCSFNYSTDLSPTVSSVTPTTVNTSSTSLTITGEKFGSNSVSVTVQIGGSSCVISDINDTSISCDVGTVPVGTHGVDVRVAGKGKAITTETVQSEAEISSISPLSGSVNGELEITFEGNGFVSEQTTVDMDGNNCTIINVTATTVVCATPSHSAATVNVIVTSAGTAYPTQTFTYSNAATPTVSQVSPTNALAGASVTITGSGFSTTASDNVVTVGGVACAVTGNPTTSSITCTLGSQQTGTYPLKVVVAGSGASAQTVDVTYEMDATGISPSTGGIAGGQTLTISGSGFLVDGTTATVCGEACTPPANASQSASQFLCLTPAKLSVTTTEVCDVVVTVNSIVDTLSSVYTYDASLTSEVTGVAPARGGTAGGTTLVIAGTGFGSNKADVTVSVGGAACSVSTVTSTQVTCITGASRPQKAKVVVEVSGNGMAKQTSADFQYIDVWSSRYTWGGNDPPTKGDLVVIPAGQILLLDTDTPVLKMLLIQGGELIFDEKDIELRSENILITNGGKFQVGTEAEPFQHKATITMYGNFRSPELPIYGAKTLALREGVLDLHGRVTPITWTRLASTAAAGVTQVVLQQEVNWQAGDQIVIASTGERHSQKETEVRTIASIDPDNVTLTLDSALTYAHIGITKTYGSFTVELRGEVGLLSHNVVVRGFRDSQWDEKIEACPAGFNTGEFATQTCFLGRFGEEMGSDQFGSCIMIHAPEKNKDLAIARISHIEVTHAGQAFRLGRYPIHFHLNGDMSSSYVRGCAIHHTFNRAVNIHGSHNTHVEHNVLYDVMGGAFFLEDGIETGNFFQYNLGTFVRASSSLLNDDITPATFWVTNPNNTISHNAAAGGTHFGFWYRMHKHPEGPSYTPNVCCKHVPLGEFKNNTAHSFGWFGLWIFEDYFPKVDGSCSASAQDLAVQFETLTAWNCEKGAEAVNSGSLQFIDFVLVNNQKAGYEGKLLVSVPQYDETNGPLYKGGVIVGHDPDLTPKTHACTHGGIVLPYQNGLIVKDVTFVNFDKSSCVALSWARIAGTCADLCGAFMTQTAGLTFIDSPHIVRYAWEYEGILEDQDASLTGIVGGSVVPTTPTFPSDKCNVTAAFSRVISGSVCDQTVRFHRFAFNGVIPKSLEAKNISLTNGRGEVQIGEFRPKRITHKPGWVVLLVDGDNYTMNFVNAEHLTNISFDGQFYQFNTGQFVIMSQQAERPDRFKVQGRNINESVGGFDPATDASGSWMYDTSSGNVQYLVSANTGSRKKRGAITYNTDRKFKLEVFRCFYKNCIPPDPPGEVLSRPDYAIPWSLDSTWDFRAGGKPTDNDNVTIPVDLWIVADEKFPIIDTLVIYGGLEFNNNANMTFNLHAKYIIIYGRLVIGWAHDPFPGAANIYLYGSHSSPIYPIEDGPTAGSKVIAVYGGLDIHGLDPGVTWTRLGVMANQGSNSVTLSEAVDWPVGSDILISATSYSAWETETFRITGKSANKMTLTLNGSLAHDHIVVSHTQGNGQSYNLGARVALLSRNVKIIGADYSNLFKESFGARVMVARTADSTGSYSGFAKVQNAEFYHTGQEGYTESYDARYSLAFMDVSNGGSRISYVRKNTFHSGFSRAIGAFGVSDLLIEDNVVHHTVGPGIVTNSDNTTIAKNLVTLSIWPGAYQDRYEPNNIEFEGGIEAILATNLKLRDNVVAGSERVGYHVRGEECWGQSEWFGNEAHVCLEGIGIFPAENAVSSTCVRYANFILWKNVDFGIYYQNPGSLRVEGLVSVENGVGIFPFIVGPSALSHQTSNKTVEVKDSFLVGKTSSYDCTRDVKDNSDHNIQLSGQARSWGNGTHGKVGVCFAVFSQGSNKAPLKPFINIMSYQAISGLMTMTNVTFANFGPSCSGSYDYAVTTDPNNDDGNHPLETQSVTFYNTPNKIFIHVPRLGKINPSDCVDMDCDALKKTLLNDLDGSFLGSPGSVIPLSEFEWDEDRRRGLGDYRIPKVMLTSLSGKRLTVSAVAPHRGVHRTPECVYRDNWRGYECHELNYKLLVFENMDADTEKRRLSPVAVLGEGYLDLINGPQDHGWCSGYTCRLRLSTFQAIVALNKSYDIYFTSTTPQSMRFHLLNSRPDEAVRIGIWYSVPNRLDVYVNNAYQMPKNGEMRNGRFFLRTDMTPTQMMPDPASDPIGSNYVSREEKMLFFVVTGETFIEIRTAAVIIVSYTLPAMTIDDFFGESLVQNLAAFLNVDPQKVRIVDVINEQSVGRRKRSVPTTTINAEIGNSPNETDSSPLTYSEIQSLETVISNGVALGTMNVLPNGTQALSVGMTPAQPPVSSQAWSDVSVDDEPYILNKAGTMSPHETPVPGREEMVFETAIKLRVYDDSSNPLDIVGSDSDPWQVTASLTLGVGSHSSAFLQGTTSVYFSKGWCNFTDLAISHPGSDYSITFSISSPSEASNFTYTLSSFTVQTRQVNAVVVSTTTDPLEDAPISVTLELQNTDTGSALSDIAWRRHTWNISASLSDGTSLGGNLETKFSSSSGRAYFTDLMVSEIGRYYLTFRVRSDPEEYDFTVDSYIDVTNTALQNLIVQKSSTCQFRFDVTYDPVQSPKDAAVFANKWAIENKNNGIRVTGVSASAGSVVVTITFEGIASNVSEVIQNMCDDVHTGTTLYSFGGQTVPMSPYMMVDGQSYYGSCKPQTKSPGLHPGILAAIIVLSLIIVILVVGIIIWKVKVVPKTKTTSAEQKSHLKYLGHVNTPLQAEDFLYSDQTFFSLKSQMPSPVPPNDTLSTRTFSAESKRDMYNDRPSSRSNLPLPAD